MLKDLNIVEFADETASNSPAPGGGSIAALNASMSAIAPERNHSTQ